MDKIFSLLAIAFIAILNFPNLLHARSVPYKLSMESFADEINDDQIIFTSISVPRYAIQTELILWTNNEHAVQEKEFSNSTSDDGNGVSAYLRYGGLPTLTNYDARYQLMKLPTVISLMDYEPSGQTTLYIGFFGGDLLHSNRYFTGSADKSLVGFTSLVITCSNEMQRGRGCVQSDILPLQFHPISKLGETSSSKNDVTQSELKINELRQFNVHVPREVDLIHIEASLVDFSKLSLCKREFKTNMNLILMLYPEIGDYQDRSSKMYELETAKICSSEDFKVNYPFQLHAERPLAGIWTLGIKLFEPTPQGDTNTTKASVKSTSRLNRDVSTIERSRWTFSTKHRSYLDAMEKNERNLVTLNSTEGTETFFIEITTKLFSCNSPVNDLDPTAAIARNSLVVKLCGNSSFPLSTVPMISDRSSSLSSKGIFSVRSNGSEYVSIPPYIPFREYNTEVPSTGPTYSPSSSKNSSNNSTAASSVSKDVTNLVKRVELESNNELPALLEHGHSVIFSSVLPPKSVLNIVGGTMQVHLKVAVPDQAKNQSKSLADFIAEVEFIVTIRYGGLPKHPRTALYKEEDTERDGIELNFEGAAKSPSSYSLLSSDATMVVQKRDSQGENSDSSGRLRRLSISSDTVSSEKQEVIFVWVKDKPLLPPLSDTELGNVYIRVDIIRTAAAPSASPTATPSVQPTIYPSLSPSASPSMIPSLGPTAAPTFVTTSVPSSAPSISITQPPSSVPTSLIPTSSPSRIPSELPSTNPSTAPSNSPTSSPSSAPTMNTTHLGEQKNQTSFDQYRNTLEVSLTLSFSHCGHDLCLNGGSCVTQAGDISVAVCECKYPWAGEYCEEFSVDFSHYVIEVIFLVASNLSMSLGIVYAFFWAEVPILGTVLLIAAIASSFYHLCDMDLFCLFSLPFKSIQVLDVLFSTVGMVAVLLYYCPLHRDTYSALVLLSIGLLVPPIVSNPTKPEIIVSVIAVSLAFVIGSWIFQVRKKYCKVCYDYNLCCLCSAVSQAARDARSSRVTSFRRAAMSDSVSLSKREKKEVELSKLIRQGEYTLVQSSPGRESKQHEGLDGEDDSISAAQQREEYEEEGEAAPGRSRSSFEDSGLGNVREIKESAKQLIREVRTTLIGVLFACIGLLCFALQTNENYWFVHSLWHYFIMSSAFFFIHGRIGFMKWMDYDEEL